jgi:hypothetical protein
LVAKEAPAKAEVPSSPEPTRKPDVVPKIINRADASAQQGTPTELPAPGPPSTDIARVAANDAKAAEKTPARLTPEPQEYQDSGPGGSLAVSLFDTASTATTSAVGAIAGLMLVLLATFAWQRRRERARLASLANREIAAASLDDRYGRTDTALALAAQHRRYVSATEPTQRSWHAPQDWGDQLPTTRAEALEFINVGPDAKEGAIKKIIDGLRQSWHPDHANSEPDRRLREMRLKQINAAWEIICGKRAEA